MSLGDIGIIVGIVVGILGLFSGLLMFFIDRRFKFADKRADARKQENVLTFEWMKSVSIAIKEMAVAIKTNRCNGELTDAADAVVECGQSLDTYLIKQNAEKNH